MARSEDFRWTSEYWIRFSFSFAISRTSGSVDSQAAGWAAKIPPGWAGFVLP
jgi:hypothetical protein